MSNKSSLKDTLTGTFHTVEDRVEKVLYEKWHIRLHKKARHHIHQLRKRPDHHKDIISFAIAFFVTLFVFIGWYFISFPRIIQSYKTTVKENSALDISANPLERIQKGFKLEDSNIQAE